MILVTGSTGHFGRHAILSLLQKGLTPSSIRAMVRTAEAAAEWDKHGVSTVVADYNDEASLQRAMEGVSKLLFVSGNDIAKRLEQHERVIRTAQAAGVQHVVYTSFIRKNESSNSPLWIVAESHVATEQWLKQSGLSYSILKNNLYMDYLPGFIGEHVLQSGKIYVPAQAGKIGSVLRSEMAEAAAVILLSDHPKTEYQFTNSTAVSYQEIADALSAWSGHPIQYISPSVEEYAQTLQGFGVPAEGIAIFSSFAVAQAQGELDAVSDDVKELLGREPMGILAYLRGVYAPQQAEVAQ